MCILIINIPYVSKGYLRYKAEVYLGLPTLVLLQYQVHKRGKKLKLKLIIFKILKSETLCQYILLGLMQTKPLINVSTLILNY